MISKFSFVDSPWVARGEMLSKASCRTKDKVDLFAEDFARKYAFKLAVRQNPDSGNFQIHHGEEKDVYYPLFEAEMTVADLHGLALELANYLAQPTIENWDGKTIRQLVV